ncbi:hypothetical protein GCM10027073_55390 [Streptomyces chlorus]|uniref:Peptidoglycan binding domain-containing protein n=1 Tax=Streptomyces chlorus TaxID=887452 RepID=A0ABW1E1Q8_9ACTN
MSRETDTPSTGPNGRGGAAYPSGTPPYGIPAVPGEAAAAGRPAARPDEQRPGDQRSGGPRSDERKTETTLTTRIRINIPGSRPIPPVVVRKTVKDGEGTGDNDTRGGAKAQAPAPAPGAPRALGAGAGTASGPGSGPGAVEPSAVAAPGGPRPAPQQSVPQQAAPAEKPASDWFAPRKSGAGKGAAGGGSGNGVGAAGGSGPAGGASGASGPSGSPGASGGGARPGGRPAGVVGGMSVTGGGSRPGGSGAPGGPGGTNGSAPGGGNGSGLSGATGGPVAPGHGGGTGSFDVTEALAAGPLGSGGTRPGAGPGAGGSGGGEPRFDDLPFFTDEDLEARNGQAGHPGQPGPPSQSPYGDQSGPGGPTTGPVTGRTGPLGLPPGGGPRGPRGGPHPGGGLSDDTASLTPQLPAPEPGAPGYGARHDNVSRHTATSGIPVVPASASFDADVLAGGPGRHTPPRLPDPVTPSPAASSKAPKKKGRSKLPLLGGAVILLVGVAYGAGLLMNHSDVPKGTTVLGVDIGGGTRDEAVKTLDKALADRLNKPLKLAVGDKTVELEPDKAGLQLDTDATIGAAARSDYNPVSVIGSLFGDSRVVDPVIPVDEEKLHAALEAAGGGSGNDGTITFESGKAVAVYGKPGAGIDVDKSTEAVEAAYRTQVETGSSSTVTVPTSTQEPTVSKAEVDRMLKEFAEPAMSANVTVQTDAEHSVPMSPQKSLWKFLRVEAVNGKLVDKPDLKALEELYGQAFDGVLITRGNGEKTPVTPQDVYGALRQALTSTTNRVAVIETDPS